MAFHNQLGKAGEELACDYLITQGFTIRETNWRVGKLEIDIVAHKPGTDKLHIVEVKTRASDEHYDPMRAITAVKKRNLVAAANAYVRYSHVQMAVQYDVVIVVGRGPDFKFQYIPNAFQPALRTYR